tara:strand:+ start:167 stop:469 length:303 start_codon:yes stop_codon:yes gene_type:complete
MKERDPMARNLMARTEAEKLIDSMKNGHIFSVQFVKKDGTVRDMVCRKGVRKGVKGTGAGYGEGAIKPLRTVFDMKKAAFRMIPTDRIVRLKVKGRTFSA